MWLVAPMSASMLAASGPVIACPASMTVIPASGPAGPSAAAAAAAAAAATASAGSEGCT